MNRSTFFALIFGTSLSGPCAAFAATPSFDCAKASSTAEKAICSHDNLAALDVKIAAEYRALRKELDPKSADALSQDQRWFVASRDSAADMPASMSPPAITQMLKTRADFLGAINPHPPTGFVGSWRNIAGGFDIKLAADGQLQIEGNAAAPVTGNWVCEYYGRGLAAGEIFKPQTEEMDENSKLVVAENANQLIFTREGAILTVQTITPPNSDNGSFCGMNGSFDGTYFLLPNGYDKFPGSF